MKKLLLGALLLLSVSIFSQSKINNFFTYDCKPLFKQTDWIVSKSVDGKRNVFQINKKIRLTEFYNSDVDSTEVTTFFAEVEGLKRYPTSDSLYRMVYQCLIDCKYSCKNRATFNPQSIQIFSKFGEDEDFVIWIDFLALNSFGVPGELKGVFIYEKGTFKLKNKHIF